METATLVPVEEYLRTHYDPDCEYVDGRIVERNLGEIPHSSIQANVIVYLGAKAKKLGIKVLPEQRVQVSPTRFRIPDITVLRLPLLDDRIVTTPPFICIEILSKDDRFSDLKERIDDYLRFGVLYVWILDPRTRKAYRCTFEGINEVKELTTESPAVVVPLAALFEE